VLSATYGVTPTGRKDRLAFLNKHLRRIESIEHTRRSGLVITGEETIFLKSKPRLKLEKETLMNAPTKFIDISAKMQTIADKGGITFRLDKVRGGLLFSLNLSHSRRFPSVHLIPTSLPFIPPLYSTFY
jgi:hypothetical protein